MQGAVGHRFLAGLKVQFTETHVRATDMLDSGSSTDGGVETGNTSAGVMYEYRDYEGYVIRLTLPGPIPVERWSPVWKVWTVHTDPIRIRHNSDAISVQQAREMVVAQGGSPEDVV